MDFFQYLLGSGISNTQYKSLCQFVDDMFNEKFELSDEDFKAISKPAHEKVLEFIHETSFNEESSGLYLSQNVKALKDIVSVAQKYKSKSVKKKSSLGKKQHNDKHLPNKKEGEEEEEEEEVVKKKKKKKNETHGKNVPGSRGHLEQREEEQQHNAILSSDSGPSSPEYSSGDDDDEEQGSDTETGSSSSEEEEEEEE